MVREQVQPLRIQKGTPGNSPTKMASVTNRPLAEVSPMAIRRNSPSFPQGNKVRKFKGMPNLTYLHDRRATHLRAANPPHSNLLHSMPTKMQAHHASSGKDAIPTLPSEEASRTAVHSRMLPPRPQNGAP